MPIRIDRLGLAVLLAALPTIASAQDTAPAASATPSAATLTYTEGAVDLDHEGLAAPATTPTLLLDGDRVRTRDGRAEVVFSDGSLLHIDRETTVEWLGDARLRLIAGRLMLRVTAATAAYVVDASAASARLDSRGEYVLSLPAPDADFEIAVARGVAELTHDGERSVVRGGEVLVVDAAGRESLRRYNSARFDDFMTWAYDRANGFARDESARYLPHELRPYGSTFDTYGRWEYADSYGYVWYPSVAIGWRPYSHGGWRFTRYGWTWFGGTAWDWPTHHFGRWGFSGSAWFWIPGKVWGPAWVSWAFAPGFVAWSPLGWDGHRGFRGRKGFHGRDAWHSWTAVPRQHFGRRGPVQSWMVNPHRLPDASRRAFVFQSVPPPGPAGRGNAVPRGSFTVAGARGISPPPPADLQRRAVPRYPTPSPTRSSDDRAGVNSWSTQRPGSVRRPGGTSTRGDMTPRTGEATPTVTAPQSDAPGDARYAIPRRPADGQYRSEDAEVFRGGNRGMRAAPPPDSQSWRSRERGDGAAPSWRRSSPEAGSGAPGAASAPGRSRDGRGGATVRSQPRSSGGDSGGGARGSDGGHRGGNARGAVRRPPK